MTDKSDLIEYLLILAVVLNSGLSGLIRLSAMRNGRKPQSDEKKESEK